MREWDEEVTHLIQQHTSSHSSVDAFEAQWRTLCMNGAEHSPAPPEMGTSFVAWQQLEREIESVHLSARFLSARRGWFRVWNTPALCYYAWKTLLSVMPMRRAVGRLLCWSVLGYALRAMIEKAMFKWFGSEMVEDYVDPNLLKRARLFLDIFHDHIGGRRFCATEQGRIGLVHLAVEEGDEVAFIEGSQALYVLRRGERGYRLIGDCYMRGFGKEQVYDLDGGDRIDIRLV